MTETITHELCLHGNEIPHIIDVYQKGGMDAVEKEWSKDVNGHGDHISLIKGNKSHGGVNKYNSVKDELIRMYPSLENVFHSRMKVLRNIYGY